MISFDWKTKGGALIEETIHDDKDVRKSELSDLRRKTARGALVSIVSQAATLVFRTGSMVIMARLLLPEDFGLVGMVTAFTGFLSLFRDAGLSMATVQRESITDAQLSTLFWINLAVGGLLALSSAALAPVLVSFYGEPRLFLIAIGLGTAFIFNGAAAQHRAMLQRNMRFAALAAIDITALIIGIAAGAAVALTGGGYWALVVMTVASPAVSVFGLWAATRWVPGLPQRNTGIGSMLWYGGTVTLNSVVVYVAYNADKVLLGRFLGAQVLGIYGRAYQLINLPTENLNGTIGMVAFPALSRLQNDPERLRSFFLKGYGLFLALVIPITAGCALFAEDIVLVFLGPQWDAAVPVFRLLAPTILAFALMNPFAWLMLATGQTRRSLNIAFMIAPVVIVGYLLGLPYGLHGVAIGYSAAMMILVPPMVLWAKHGTLITAGDVVKTIASPALSIALGALAAFATWGWLRQLEPALLRLTAANVVMFGTYAISLLFLMRQGPVYASLLKDSGLWPKGRDRDAKKNNSLKTKP
jgi:O-antigen/teichoic acid export membrane protein